MKAASKMHGSACLRCVRQKKKCEPEHGTCNNCIRADVECSNNGSNAAGNPSRRALLLPFQRAIHHLRQELTAFEGTAPAQRPLGPIDEFPSGNVSSAQRRRLSHEQGLEEEPVVAVSRRRADTEAVLRFARSICGRVVRNPGYMVYLNRLHMGAELPFPLTHRLNDSSLRPAKREAQSLVAQLPFEVTRKLLAVYTERLLPQCPIFSPAEVQGIYSRVYSTSTTSKPSIRGDNFIICIILAIATLNSKSDDYRKVMDVADSFRQEAMDRDDNGEVLATTSIRCLQALLLLAQYGLFMSQHVDLWHTVSEAMRVAIELGLHQDPPPASGLDTEVLQLRRRLFWATYSMERTITLTCHRPFAIRDDQIKLPWATSTNTGADALTFGDSSTISRYLKHLSYCSLQTEISDVNISAEPIPSPSLNYSDWVESCERRVEELRGSNWTETALIPDWLDLAAWRCLAWLYMPCPKNPCPSDQAIFKFIQALLRMLDIYWELAKARSLKLCWFAVHHAYEIGTQMLFCMQNYPLIVKSVCDKFKVLDALTHLSDFLIYMEERWPASVQCRSLLDKLKKDIIEAFIRDQDAISTVNAHSGEQRIVDLIFRKNGHFFLMAEEPFDLNFHFDDLLSDGTLGLPSDLTSLFNDISDTFNMHDDLFDTAGDPTLLHTASLPTPTPSVALDFFGEYFAQQSTEAQQLITSCSQTLSSLHACRLCRSKRIKCTRTLPSCHNCVDYGKECLYKEPSTGDWISGVSLHQMQDEIRNLLKSIEEVRRVRKDYLTEAQLCSNPEPPGCEKNRRSTFLTFETHYGPSVCYLGDASVLGQFASGTGSASSEPEVNLVPPGAIFPGHELVFRSLDELSDGAVEILVKQYLDCFDIFYPILGETLVSDLINARRTEPVPTATDAQPDALLNLLVAIALLSSPFTTRSATFYLSNYYFERAMSLASTSDQLHTSATLSALRFALLICVYVWLNPEAGNLPRLINASCRLCLDLLESQDLKADDTAALHVLFRTAYVMDTDSAVALGRPNYLTEWTDLGKMVVTATHPDQNSGTLSFLVFNLARLRSKIHKAILCFAATEENLMELYSTSIKSFEAQIEDWWKEWEQETTKTRPNWPENSSRQLPIERKAFQYGLILKSETLALLRVLAGFYDPQADQGLRPLAAEAVIVSFAGALQMQLADSPNGRAADHAFPICWNHYSNLFGAGLGLFDSDAIDQIPETRRHALLQQCCELLTLCERCIGSRDWTLSSRLLERIQEAGG